MTYATYEYGDERHVGEVDGCDLVPLQGLVEIGCLTPLTALADAERLKTERIPIAALRLLPVKPNPSKFICVGLNYADHIAETGRDSPSYPVLFPKYADSLIGATDDIGICPAGAGPGAITRPLRIEPKLTMRGTQLAGWSPRRSHRTPAGGILFDGDLRIPMPDGVELVADLFRPTGPGPVPSWSHGRCTSSTPRISAAARSSTRPGSIRG